MRLAPGPPSKAEPLAVRDRNVPGKARPPKPGSGQAKKAAVRKRTGGLYAVPDAAPSANAAPSAPATAAGTPDKVTARKRSGHDGATLDGTPSAQTAPPDEAVVPGAPDRSAARELSGRERAVPDEAVPAERDPVADAKRPGEEAAVPGWAVPGVADRGVAGDRPAGEDAVPDWAVPDWMVPDETLVPLETDVAAAGLWPGAEEAARDSAAAREWFGGEEAARAACLRLLARAPRTRAQLAAALRRRRVPDEIAESVLARFTEVGLIDDAAFARAWVESRYHSRGLARRALAAELRQRGVADGEVRAAVGSLGTQDEVAAARRLVAKRVAASRGRPLQARARQLLGMLARKGYSAGLAAQVVREALEQEEPDNPDDRLDLAQFCEDSASGDWL
jgi:regulatory protein